MSQPALTESLRCLDPGDWSAFRRQAHALLDELFTHMEERPGRRVWSEPPSVPGLEGEQLPERGEGLDGVRERLRTQIFPYDLGNLHPRFFGWVHGAGTPGGVLAAATEAALNANTGGRDHVGTRLEHQVLAWFRDAFGLPGASSGILTTGTSLANVIALSVARERAFPGIRERGYRAITGPPRIYASRECHLSIRKAAELLGLGRDAVVPVEVDRRLRMRPDRLAAALRRDRRRGDVPVAVVASLGTASTGAIDPLDAVADVAAESSVWLHTDAAFGGLVVLSRKLEKLAGGVARSDSVAFDFHKWMHVAYAVGCLLVRDTPALLATFGGRPAYLQGESGGPAGSPVPWPMEMGPELSRDFRALRIWWLLVEHGRRGVAEQVERSVALAETLGKLVRLNPSLELLQEPQLQIVVFRAVRRGASDHELDALNRKLVRRLQKGGVVLPSETTVGGRTAIRVSLTNHRTTRKDLHILIHEIEREVDRIE